MNELTPRQIVAALDKHIVGQADAKRAVAVAVRNRWRRQQLPENLRREVTPKNILMSGPTGVGKTEIARRLATLTASPFVKVEATKFTEVGYHGRDVEGMVRDLLDAAIVIVRDEMTAKVRAEADAGVEARLLDLLVPGEPYSSDPEAVERRDRTREKFAEKLRAGELEDAQVDLSIENKPNVANMLAGAGLDIDMQGMFERMLPTRRESRRMRVREARRFLLGQEADKLLDQNEVNAQAIERAEQSGIIFLDEIDKIAGSKKSDGPDVSRQGVQRDLLPIVEGSTVQTKHGPVRTDHILFIAAGAFHDSEPADLMPELQGRFPIRVELGDLNKSDFVRILTEPDSALTKQQVQLLATEGVKIDFKTEAIDLIAQVAYDVNRKTANIGARRLHTIMERLFEPLNFDADNRRGDTITIDAAFVREQFGDVLKDKGWSRFKL
jgi:ATP-dependent HslUV protease ATP-binding subunit HslU